jgi:hypothetical protein
MHVLTRIHERTYRDMHAATANGARSVLGFRLTRPFAAALNQGTQNLMWGVTGCVNGRWSQNAVSGLDDAFTALIVAVVDDGVERRTPTKARPCAFVHQ